MKVKNGDATNEGQTTDITVYEYFTKHCGIELTESAYMPCLIVGRPNRPNYLPLEVCIAIYLSFYHSDTFSQSKFLIFHIIFFF